MSFFTKAVLLPIIAISTLLLGGCHAAGNAETSPLRQPAVVTVAVDLSMSNDLLNSSVYADRVIDRVGNGVLQQQLGDRVRVLTIGSRTVDRAVDELSLRSSRKKRLSTVKGELEASLRDLLKRTRFAGGDSSTNILYTLENAHLTCTPRSAIYILSDGIEASDAYSVGKALGSGKPINLPSPNEPYLKGCTVHFIGIGVSSEMAGGREAQTLPNAELQRLKAGWRAYFTSVGVSPEDIEFVSVI